MNKTTVHYLSEMYILTIRFEEKSYFIYIEAYIYLHEIDYADHLIISIETGYF